MTAALLSCGGKGGESGCTETGGTVSNLWCCVAPTQSNPGTFMTRGPCVKAPISMTCNVWP